MIGLKYGTSERVNEVHYRIPEFPFTCIFTSGESSRSSSCINSSPCENAIDVFRT